MNVQCFSDRRLGGLRFAMTSQNRPDGGPYGQALTTSAHLPRIRPIDQLLDIPFTFRFGGFELLANEVDVAFLLDIAEYANGLGEIGLTYSAQEEGQA